MHELSMAQAIVDTVLDAAQKNEAQDVLEVTIEIGQITMLNPEQLKFLLNVCGRYLDGRSSDNYRRNSSGDRVPIM